MEESRAREAICAWGRRLWDRGLVGASEGNLSVRLTDGRILCTPGGRNKGRLFADDAVILSPDGRPEGSLRPSSEYRIHLRAFARRPDAHAVVHAHPPYATGFATAGKNLPVEALPEAALVLGRVALVPFGMPGADELAEVLAPWLDQHNTFLLANHGAATLGRCLDDAGERMETLERVAQIAFVARHLGGVMPLPPEAARYFQRVAEDVRFT